MVLLMFDEREAQHLKAKTENKLSLNMFLNALFKTKSNHLRINKKIKSGTCTIIRI